MVKKKAKVDTKKVEVKKAKNIIPIVIGVVIIVALFVLIMTKLTVKRVELGNTVTVEYTGYLPDMSVFDTSIKDVGVAHSLDKTDYGPLTFTLNGQEVIPGFEEEIVGMKVGDKKKFTLSPDRAYGEKSEQLVREFLRVLNITKYSDVGLKVYRDYFGKDPVVGEEFNVPSVPWKLIVLGVNEENVSVDSLVNVGDRYTLEGTSWETVIIGVKNDTILLRQYPNIGDYISTPKNPKFAVVTEITDDTFFADANHPLAGKTLIYEVEVKEIAKQDN